MNRTRAARAVLLLLCFIPAAAVAGVIEGLLDLSWWSGLLVVALIPVFRALWRVAYVDSPRSVPPSGDSVLGEEARSRHARDVQNIVAMINGRDLRPRRFSVSANKDEVDEYLRLVVEYLEGRGAPMATEDMMDKHFSWSIREPGYDSADVARLIAQVTREIDRLLSRQSRRGGGAGSRPGP
ncbi:hypothetical protein HTZ77_34660 [Nonomuraea sp. SMC257]|uniref:DivIVA domain-containing protein n=1 Tax=Nonomuraea montanisoli TaxID=2741721 RepID=A0A7Y6M7D1_9ACTN|nr:hypothetical protein [Nonomuraea montanisoli]NUW36511.1 hypothetical protein [Nonomuraea montanisoli]